MSEVDTTFLISTMDKMMRASNEMQQLATSFNDSIKSLSVMASECQKNTASRAKIIQKYYFDDQFQPHTPFPGVVSTAPQYDIQQVRQDGAQMATINKVLKDNEAAKQTQQKLMRVDFSNLVHRYQTFLASFQALEEQIAQVNEKVEN